MMERIKRLHAVFFNRLAGALLSVAAFYVLTVGVVIGIMFRSTLPIIQLLSSGWYQAVALPLVAITGAAAAFETMRFIRETHDTVMESHTQQNKLLETQNTLLEALHLRHDSHDKILAELQVGSSCPPE